MDGWVDTVIGLQKGLSVGGKYVATDGWTDTVIDCQVTKISVYKI